MWADTHGEGVRVAVIDTGIDAGNSQIKPNIEGAGKKFVGGGGKPTVDQVGHGTKVAGIIAARPKLGSGFYGIAPKAKVIALQQTSEEKAGTADSLAAAIEYAVQLKVNIINISQGTDASAEKLIPSRRRSRKRPAKTSSSSRRPETTARAVRRRTCTPPLSSSSTMCCPLPPRTATTSAPLLPAGSLGRHRRAGREHGLHRPRRR